MKKKKKPGPGRVRLDPGGAAKLPSPLEANFRGKSSKPYGPSPLDSGWHARNPEVRVRALARVSESE